MENRNDITLPLPLLYEEQSLRRTVKLLSAIKGGEVSIDPAKGGTLHKVEGNEKDG